MVVLGEHRSSDSYARNKVILRISNGDKSHKGMCTDPPILRNMEFILSAGCSCAALMRSMEIISQDYSECRGSCDRLVEVSVSIYTKTGTLNVCVKN